MMLSLIIFTTTVVIVNGLPLNNNEYKDEKIVGGYAVDIKDIPYQVAIIKSDQLWCGGSIVSTIFVLTAAHCVIYANAPLVIHAGSSFWANSASVHHVDYNITYGSEKHMDVALLHVIEPFVFDETHQMIPLFDTDEIPQTNTIAVVSGWGITEEHGVSDRLRAVQVPIVDRQMCNSSYSGIINVSEICAGSTGKDSCQVDSGGPLVINGRQAGIVSMGSGCGSPLYRGIYANVAYFSQWIINKMSTKALKSR